MPHEQGVHRPEQEADDGNREGVLEERGREPDRDLESGDEVRGIVSERPERDDGNLLDHHEGVEEDRTARADLYAVSV